MVTTEERAKVIIDWINQAIQNNEKLFIFIAKENGADIAFIDLMYKFSFLELLGMKEVVARRVNDYIMINNCKESLEVPPGNEESKIIN